MTESIEKSMSYCLQLANESSRDTFLDEFPSAVVVLVNPDEDQPDSSMTVDHGGYESVPTVTQKQLLQNSSAVFLLQKKEGANTLTRMIMIGRGEDCDIVIPRNRVSRCHTLVHRRPSSPSNGSENDDADREASPVTFTVRDAGATNGTIINGQALSFGKGHELKTGDQISLGPTVSLIFFEANDFYTMLSESGASEPDR